MAHLLDHPHTDRCLTPSEVDPSAWVVSAARDPLGVRAIGPCPACGALGQEAWADVAGMPLERATSDGSVAPSAAATRADEDETAADGVVHAAPVVVELVVRCRCGVGHGAEGAPGCGASWGLAVGLAADRDGPEVTGVAAIEITRRDVAAVEELVANEQSRLVTVRTRAAQWLAGVSAAATLLGTVGVLVAPARAAEVEDGARSVVGVLVLVALVAFASAAVQAYQAAYGDLGGGPELAATPVRGAGERWSAARRRVARAATDRLRVAVVLGLSGLGSAALGALIAWFAAV